MRTDRSGSSLREEARGAVDWAKLLGLALADENDAPLRRFLNLWTAEHGRGEQRAVRQAPADPPAKTRNHRRPPRSVLAYFAAHGVDPAKLVPWGYHYHSHLDGGRWVYVKCFCDSARKAA